MIEFNKILVVLENSAEDEKMLKKYSEFQKIFNPQEVTFIYITDETWTDLPPGISFDIEAGYEEDIVAIKSLEQIDKDHTSLKVNHLFKKGKFLDETLKEAKKDYDLVILQKTEAGDQHKRLCRKLTRKIPTSILFIEESLHMDGDIEVAFDFSEHSLIALKTMRAYFPNDTINCHHVFSIPPVYIKLGMSAQQFAKDVSQRIEKAFYEFLEKNKIAKENVKLNLVEGSKPSSELSEIFEKSSPKMVAIGSKGKTDATAVFMGSVAENISDDELRAPIFIIKKKGETIPFLEAILQ